MGLIYSLAQFTIIAAAGTNPAYGIPGISRPRLINISEPVGPESADEHLYLETGLIENHIPETMWASRAWSKQLSVIYISLTHIDTVIFSIPRGLSFQAKTIFHGPRDRLYLRARCMLRDRPASATWGGGFATRSKSIGAARQLFLQRG